MERAEPSAVSASHRDYPVTALVLQGGGALGSYQAGVYEGLAEAGIHPNWVAGISIGALNAAVIAGNPAERRIEQLRAFWEFICRQPWAPSLPAAPADLPDAWSALTPPAARSKKTWCETKSPATCTSLRTDALASAAVTL